MFDINKATDLELAEAQGSLYNQLMQIQGNLLAINQEIKARKPKTDISQPAEQPTE